MCPLSSASLLPCSLPEQWELPDTLRTLKLARGSLSVNGERLSEGDGARIRNAGALRFDHGEQAEVLVFDLRSRELPSL